MLLELTLLAIFTILDCLSHSKYTVCLLKNKDMGVGGMPQWLSEIAAYIEDPVLFPAPTWQLRSI